MKQTAWTPSSLNPSVTLGEKIAVSSVLSIDTHSALINPAILSPVPSIPFRVKSHTGNLHIHPAFSFRAGIRYFVGSAKLVSADKNGAVTYIGTGKSDGGLNLSIYPVSLSITSSPSEIRPGDVLNIGVGYSAVWNFEVFYSINSGTPVLYSEISASGIVTVDTAGIVFNHADVLTIIVKDSESTLQDTVDFTAVVESLIIDSLNNGDPFYFIGSYAEGTHYFFSINGDIVELSSPFRSEVFVGIGNSDKNIDLDIKTLALELDAFSVPVLLDVAFTVSGTATLVSNKVYIEAYNGSVWIDLNAGNPVNVVLGEFELTTAQLKASDGFESNMTYVVRARDFDGYSTPASKNIVTIATIELDEIGEQTQDKAFDVTGSANCDTVKVLVDGVSQGTATVSGGTFTKSITINSTGSKVIRVEDAVNSNAYDSETINVESVIIALQFGGTGDDNVTWLEKIGTDYYIAGTTKSSTLFGESTGYSAGYRNFLAKLNSEGTKQWVLFGSADSDTTCIRHACYDAGGGKIYWINQNVSGASTNNEKISRVSLSGTVESTYTFGYAYEYLLDITCDANNVYICGRLEVAGGAGTRDSAWAKIAIATFNSRTIYGISATGATGNKQANQIQVSGSYVYCACSDYTNNKVFATRSLIADGTYTYSNVFSYPGCRLSEISSSRFILFCSGTSDRTIKMFSTLLVNGSNGLYSQQIDTKTDSAMGLYFDGSSFKLSYRNSDNTKAVINTVTDADTYTGNAVEEFTINTGTLSTVRLGNSVLFGTLDGKLVSSSTDAGGTDGYIYDEG